MIGRLVLGPVCLALAIVIWALACPPVLASPADDLASATAAIEAAISDQKPADAETLAIAALTLAEETLGTRSLPAANLRRLLGDALYYQDRFADAEPHYRTALSIRQALLGEHDLDTAQSFNDIALDLNRLERFAEAEPYYRRCAEIREELLGLASPRTARSLLTYARNFDAAGDYVSAAREMARAIESAKLAFGPADPTTAEWLSERALILHDAGDAEATEAAYHAALEVGVIAFPPEDLRLAVELNGLGSLLYSLDRAEEAVPLLQSALAIRDAGLGPVHNLSITTADRLARSLSSLGRVIESEPLLRRVLAARELSDGPDSVRVADALRWLGRAAAEQDHNAEAEIAFKRALAISESKLGPTDLLTGFDLIALGQLYSGQQRFIEAGPLLERAVAVFDANPDGRQSAAAGRVALSFLAIANGDAHAALALAGQSLADYIDLYGPRSRQAADIMLTIGGYHLETSDLSGAESEVVAALDVYRTEAPRSRAYIRATSQLGRIRQEQGRLQDALTLHQSALDSLTARYGSDSTELEPALADIGSTLFEIGDYRGAATHFGKAIAIVEQLASIDSAAAFEARTGAIEDQAIARAAIFDFLIKTNYRLAGESPDTAQTLAADAFSLAQRVIESKAAGALAQMAARQASGSSDLGKLVRERQDLVAHWQRQDTALTLALGEANPDTSTIATLRQSLTETDDHITSIDAELATGFPKFAALQRPAPLTLGDVQSRLDSNETLLFFADTTQLGAAGFETYLWLVPKSGPPLWRKLARSSGELSAAVREFRTAMGVSGATRGPNAVGQAKGKDRVGRVLTAANELYGTLLGDVAQLIAGKDLIIIPSKSLSALPFHALVSALPDEASPDRFRDAQWLALDHTITILPSVASLALSASPPASSGRTSYTAFANPLLLGRAGEDRRAFARTGCRPVATSSDKIEVAELPELSTLFRGATADVAAVRLLQPLPETTDEVCAIAQVLGATSADLHLGPDATEAVIKQLSAEGALAATNILHFATHGLVSGDLLGLAEPAIVLTPPDVADTLDDGLLTASEVSSLKLDAEWVILSACNTAASDGGGEALSGLARAFFYAGARSLLVSHWPVNSDSAVRLTTNAFAELDRDPDIGRAEALRRAMVAEIDRGGSAADPGAWAPFILVGTGR